MRSHDSYAGAAVMVRVVQRFNCNW